MISLPLILYGIEPKPNTLFRSNDEDIYNRSD